MLVSFVENAKKILHNRCILTCVDCTLNYDKNWVKYVAISYLPLTVFLFIVMCFRVSVFTGLVNAVILLSQMLTGSQIMRWVVTGHFFEKVITNRFFKNSIVAIFSLMSIWNLDFFRLVCSPFCLHPEMSSLQILALDYAIAAYPLLLIVLTYILVELHARPQLQDSRVALETLSYMLCFFQKRMEH